MLSVLCCGLSCSDVMVGRVKGCQILLVSAKWSPVLSPIYCARLMESMVEGAVSERSPKAKDCSEIIILLMEICCFI